MESIAAEVIKIFRQIIYRDVYYTISGGLIIFYVANFILKIPEVIFFDKIHGLVLFAFVGISLAVGLANQEFWSQTGLITTTIYRRNYWKIFRWMYYLHTRRSWVNRNLDSQKEISSPWEKELWSRMIDLKQIGSSLAACNLTLATIALYSKHLGNEYGWLAITNFLGFLIFSSICWVKTMQQAEAQFNTLIAD